MITSKYLNSKNIIEFIFILLPISLVFSNIVSELLVFILIVFYLSSLSFNKIVSNLKEPIILLLIFFWLYLILNFFINYGKNPSLERTLFFIRFPLLILSISFCINDLNINLKKIFTYWAIIISILCIDLVFQFFNQVNLIGNKAIQQGSIYRLGGFMGDELKISNLIFNFGILTFSYLLTTNYINNNKKNLTTIIFFSLILFSIFITGERSNFITISLFSLLLLIFLFFNNLKLFLKIFSIILILFATFSLSNSKISDRMINNLFSKQIKHLSINTDKNFLYKNSHYFAHYSVAYQIFEKNKFFGVGLKNFRNFCDNEDFNYQVHPNWQEKKCALHPHNFYFEILSETGLLGMIILGSFFIISLIRFFKSKNNTLIVSSIIVLVYFIPFIPKGSFFTNWTALIFWTIFGIIYSIYIKSKKII